MSNELICKDLVISIHYSVIDDEKEVIDSSEGQPPLEYLHGHSQIVPGLEQALEGKKVGDKINVTVPPALGYGEYNDELIADVPRDQFPEDAPIEEGSMFEVSSPSGNPMIATIVAVNGSEVTLDGNHPLAGKQLHFRAEVIGVRKATKEEMEHGHAHGPGGHSHE